jgi:hypothetical protein
MRIFRSYGLDEHMMLALWLRDDLRKHDYEVWFDEERLLPALVIVAFTWAYVVGEYLHRQVKPIQIKKH